MSSCLLVPEVNGEQSILYKELSKLIKNRAITNFIYASYLQSGVAASMNNAGKRVNNQGQHNAKDVYDFFNVASMLNSISDLGQTEINIGAKDIRGNIIYYDNAKDTLIKVQSFNENNTNFAAYVVQQGNMFKIVVEPRDSRTIARVVATEEALKLWQVVEQVFNNVGVDINTVANDPSLTPNVNATKPNSFIAYLKNLQLTRNNILSKNDLKLLLSLNESSARVQRLITKFGDINNVVDKIYDSYRTPGTVTASEMSLIEAALQESKNYKGMDINAVIQQLNNESDQFKIDNEASNIVETLKDLDEKYGIDFNEIHLTDSTIDSLSKAAANAVITLQRQLREIEETQGITSEGKQIEKTLQQLMKEIQTKKYYQGCLQFLHEALNQIQQIDNDLYNLGSLTGTIMEVASQKSKVLLKIQSLRTAYYPIVKALSDLDSLITDEEINDTDKANIENQAKAVKEIFDKHEAKVTEVRKTTMMEICTHVLGESGPNGIAIANIVNMAEGDSSIFDFLYSVSDQSNTLLSSMGGIIRDAQDSRNAKLTAIENRITRATKKLYDSGSNSQFMYGEDGYIISDLDWQSYNEARKNAIKQLKQQGLSGLELKAAIKDWEINNTEERVVDNISGRTERVPNTLYRKPFPNLTSAQLEYYKEMIQIKGEIGTLLPSYAQKQYLPPQLRRSFLDAVADAKTVKDVCRAIWNKIGDWFIIREDDTDFAQMGVIEGEDYGITVGSMNNTPLKQIPIFYVRQIKDQKELLKDFSGGIQALASTAINYDAMSSVREIVEFMGDYIKYQGILATKNGTKTAEAVSSRASKIFKDLYATAEGSNTAALVDGFLDGHMYGVKVRDGGKYAKFIQTLLKYTSIKNLSTNALGAIANYAIAKLNMLIEAGGAEFYNIADLTYAHGVLFGDRTAKVPGKLIDFFENQKNSLDVLLADFFEPIPGRFQEQGHKRYFKNQLRKVSSEFNFLAGYSAGENIVHYLGMYAVLHNTKVLLDGEETHLLNIFEKTPKTDGTSELKIKDNSTDLNGNPITLDSEFLANIRRRIRYANQSTQGGMNDEDKGVLHQYLLGKAIMQFRQWMVKTYARRYRMSTYWDATLKQERESEYLTMHKLVNGFLNDYFKTSFENAVSWKDMNENQVANFRRFVSERLIWGSLWLLSFALGEPEDHKKDFWYRLWIYENKRAMQDVSSTLPLGAVLQAKSIASNPIPSLSTINGFLYPIYGLEDIDETLKSGPYKGYNKYGRNLLRYTVPFYKQLDQLMTIDEDESLFKNFDTSNKFR